MDFLLFIIPIDVHTNVFAVPILQALELHVEDFEYVFCVFASHIFHSKVIDALYERDGSCLVLPQTWYHWALLVAMRQCAMMPACGRP